ncbi:hypothetical protein KM043_010371 [Ampulex compressa]|nr:hypothetical protein KM043_010371 [Ampulex compressa]
MKRKGAAVRHGRVFGFEGAWRREWGSEWGREWGREWGKQEMEVNVGGEQRRRGVRGDKEGECSALANVTAGSGRSVRRGAERL